MQNNDDRPVWEILRPRADRILGPSEYSKEPPQEPQDLIERMMKMTEDGAFGWIIGTPPGSGKSRDATALVNEAWNQHGKKGLYLMLNHAAIEERLQHLEEDGEAAAWSHWRRHSDSCERQCYNIAGYIGYGECTCGRGKLEADGPAIAPIEYILPGSPDQDWPIVSAVGEFDFWVIDEIDFRRFLGFTSVTLREVRSTSRAYPSEPVRDLLKALAEAMEAVSELDELKDGARGRRLYNLLALLLEERGKDFSKLMGDVAEAELATQPWEGTEQTKLQTNFPRVLVPVLWDEFVGWRSGSDFNPRVHIVRGFGGPELHVWWRKTVSPCAMPELTFIMDASADWELLNEVFFGLLYQNIDRPEWPDNVRVHQWGDGTVARGELGLAYESTAFQSEYVKERHTWYEHIKTQLAELPRDWSVGIITHMTIEDEAKGYITDLGFEDVRSLHYGAERGSNIMEDVRILVLLGLPIPNVDGFKEEAQAFLSEGPAPLVFK